MYLLLSLLRVSVPFTLFTISLITIPYANLDFSASLPYFLNLQTINTNNRETFQGFRFLLPLLFMLLQITQHYFSLFLFIQFWLSPTSFIFSSLLSSKFFTHLSPCPQPSKIHLTLSPTLFPSSSSLVHPSNTCSQDYLSYPHTLHNFISSFIQYLHSILKK